MDWTSLAGTLAQLGLTGLGTAFAGPLGGALGGAIGQEVARALGVPATPAAVRSALEADPDAARARLADLESARLADIRELELRTADTANARAMQIAAVHDNHWSAAGPAVLTAIILVLVVIAVAAVGLGWLREDGIVVGWVLATGTTVVAYWFGSSQGSKRNADVVRGIATAANIPSPAQIAGAAVGVAVGTKRRS